MKQKYCSFIGGMLFLVMLLFIFIGCPEVGPPVPPDCPEDIIIKKIIDIDTQKETQIMNGNKSLISYGWKINSEYDISYLELYCGNYLCPNPILREKQITFSRSVCSSDTFNWDGTRKNNKLRTITTLPGNYYIRVRFGINGSASEGMNFKVVVNSWDTDGDGISDAVENENTPSTTTIAYGSNTYNYAYDLSKSQPPIISPPAKTGWEYNEETHDYSLANGNWTSGSLVNGLRIANYGIGYQYWPGSDVEDTDNWGTLELINLVEKVARKWNASYPVITSMDMSKKGGGSFTGHTQHQKGLEVDVRYIRNDNSSSICDLYAEPGDPDGLENPDDYSSERTQAFVSILIGMPEVFKVIVHQDTNLEPHPKVEVDGNYNQHTDHMHVWLYDPDGVNN